jgi:hypothetical protein
MPPPRTEYCDTLLETGGPDIITDVPGTGRLPTILDHFRSRRKLRAQMNIQTIIVRSLRKCLPVSPQDFHSLRGIMHSQKGDFENTVGHPHPNR